ncbi:MAG: hypothetical protein KF769_15760 [Parvibaculum sp.]|nr:hypothetical protein [Parvibaculum sp.]
MPGPLHVIFRLLMIFIGIIAAALAAGITLMLVETSGLMRPADVTEGQARDALFVHVLVISGFAMLLGFLPGFVAGLLAEIFRWRTIVYYGVVGGLIGVYLLFEPIPAWINITREGPSLITNAVKAYPAAGIVAGAMYWLVTGCKAGFVRDKIEEDQTT